MPPSELEARFRVAGPQIIHETFEGGETVLIDLVSGCYFSVTGGGPALWARLVRGETCAEIVAGWPGADAEAVRGFAARCVQEKLLLPDATLTAPAPGAAGEPWAAPQMERFTDMQDLLLLDPIHEVDAAGWPRAAAPSA